MHTHTHTHREREREREKTCINSTLWCSNPMFAASGHHKFWFLGFSGQLAILYLCMKSEIIGSHPSRMTDDSWQNDYCNFLYEMSNLKVPSVIYIF